MASGKPRMVALAAMRKLLMIAIGVLRSGRPLQADLVQKAGKQEREEAQ